MTTDDLETSNITGVGDKDYDLLRVTQGFLKSAHSFEGIKRYAEEDGDRELADFLGRAQAESRRSAAEAAQLLRARFLAG